MTSKFLRYSALLPFDAKYSCCSTVKATGSGFLRTDGFDCFVGGNGLIGISFIVF